MMNMIDWLKVTSVIENQADEVHLLVSGLPSAITMMMIYLAVHGAIDYKCVDYSRLKYYYAKLNRTVSSCLDEFRKNHKVLTDNYHIALKHGVDVANDTTDIILKLEGLIDSYSKVVDKTASSLVQDEN